MFIFVFSLFSPTSFPCSDLPRLALRSGAIPPFNLRLGTRPPSAKKPRNSSKYLPVASLHQEQQRRGSNSPQKLEKQVLYAGGHKHHFISLLSVSSLAARRKPWTKHSAKKDQEGLLSLLTINGRILQLLTTMETDSRDRQGPNHRPLRRH